MMCYAKNKRPPLLPIYKRCSAIIRSANPWARIVKKLSTSELAERIGISRALLQRIEKGNPGCSIGVVFEAAAICGVPLFELDQRSLARSLAHQSAKLALLPQSVRVSKLVVKDAF